MGYIGRCGVIFLWKLDVMRLSNVKGSESNLLGVSFHITVGIWLFWVCRLVMIVVLLFCTLHCHPPHFSPASYWERDVLTRLVIVTHSCHSVLKKITKKSVMLLSLAFLFIWKYRDWTPTVQSVCFLRSLFCHFVFILLTHWSTTLDWYVFQCWLYEVKLLTAVSLQLPFYNSVFPLSVNSVVTGWPHVTLY